MSAIREMGHARTLSDQLLPGDPVAVTTRVEEVERAISDAAG
jgi:hypothetical protein